MLCCTNSLLPTPCRHPGRAGGPGWTGAVWSGADHRPAGWGTASSSASASLVTCGQPTDPWARPPSGAPSPPAGPGETRPVVCALVVGGCHTAGDDHTESCCSSAPWALVASLSPGPRGATDGHRLPCLLVRFVLCFTTLEKEVHGIPSKAVLGTGDAAPPSGPVPRTRSWPLRGLRPLWVVPGREGPRGGCSADPSKVMEKHARLPAP